MECQICPRKCRVDRKQTKGVCSMGNEPVVAKACLHMWEEPCISGTRGSGTVFFSGCNLKCRFCQNFDISQLHSGKEISVERLGQIYMALQDKGAHNINLVNPTHFIEQISWSLENTPLNIPVVYNSNGYETLEGLQRMKGLVDVYLPDLKYVSTDLSLKYSGAGDYFQYASSAILEMIGQVGPAVLDGEGIMQKGVVVRHLILPGYVRESIRVLDWMKENLPADIYVSVMSQYTPYFQAEQYPEINRRITRWEYDKVLNHFYKLGFKNGYVQERESAEEEYIPDFNLEGMEGF